MATGQRLEAYERVTSAWKRASGLGLETPGKAIEDFAGSRGAEVLARFPEVASGRKADWRELLKALHFAKVTGATLVIAKLYRLSKNAAFLLTLRDSGVRFVAVGMLDHVRPACQHTVPVAEAVHEQWGNSSGGRLRLLGVLYGDGLLRELQSPV